MALLSVVPIVETQRVPSSSDNHAEDDVSDTKKTSTRLRATTPEEIGDAPDPRAPRFDRSAIDPTAIRRAWGASQGPELVRLPTVRDQVWIVGGSILVEGLRDAVIVDVSEERADALLPRTPSLAAVVARDAASAKRGAIARIRAERPHVPVLIASSALEADRELAALGIAAIPTRDEEDVSVVATSFVREALAMAEHDRRVLDARCVRWILTSREAELVWLSAHIRRRARIEALMGIGKTTFKSHVHHILGKLAVESFGDIGRIARG